jgi:hypothetical protein
MRSLDHSVIQECDLNRVISRPRIHQITPIAKSGRGILAGGWSSPLFHLPCCSSLLESAFQESPLGIAIQ